MEGFWKFKEYKWQINSFTANSFWLFLKNRQECIYMKKLYRSMIYILPLFFSNFMNLKLTSIDQNNETNVNEINTEIWHIHLCMHTMHRRMMAKLLLNFHVKHRKSFLKLFLFVFFHFFSSCFSGCSMLIDGCLRFKPTKKSTLIKDEIQSEK